MQSSKGFYLFAVVGVCLILGAGVLAVRTASLVSEGVVVAGSVVEVSESSYKDKDGKTKRRHSSTISYSPVGGQRTTFKQSGDYGRGSQVEVLYSPNDPSTAKVNSFSSVWGSSVALGAFGLLFALIGGGLGYVVHRREQEIAELMVCGRNVPAVVVGIKSKQRSKKGRRRWSYQVVARAVEPMPGLPSELLSETLTHEPSDSIIGTEVELLVNPENPRSYYLRLRGME